MITTEEGELEVAAGPPVMDWEMPYQDTPFMNYHEHWAEIGINPMPVWILPGKGDMSAGIPNQGVFALGWMFSESPDGTGVFYRNDDDSVTWYVNNAPEQARTFHPV